MYEALHPLVQGILWSRVRDEHIPDRGLGRVMGEVGGGRHSAYEVIFDPGPGAQGLRKYKRG